MTMAFACNRFCSIDVAHCLKNSTKKLYKHFSTITFYAPNTKINYSRSSLLDHNDLCINNLFQFASSRSLHVPSFYDRFVFPEPPELISEEEHDNVISHVNKSIASSDVGRLFAVIVFGGQQFKVTDNDLIQVNHYMEIDNGERIRLEKVLLVGGRDFTLVGRPLVRRSLVKIEATVVEKTPGAEKFIQNFIPKARFDRKIVYTPEHTVLRINSIEAYPEV